MFDVIRKEKLIWPCFILLAVIFCSGIPLFAQEQEIVSSEDIEEAENNLNKAKNINKLTRFDASAGISYDNLYFEENPTTLVDMGNSPSLNMSLGFNVRLPGQSRMRVKMDMNNNELNRDDISYSFGEALTADLSIIRSRSSMTFFLGGPTWGIGCSPLILSNPLAEAGNFLFERTSWQPIEMPEQF